MRAIAKEVSIVVALHVDDCLQTLFTEIFLFQLIEVVRAELLWIVDIHLSVVPCSQVYGAIYAYSSQDAIEEQYDDLCLWLHKLRD